jgi:four helix bundle protein
MRELLRFVDANYAQVLHLLLVMAKRYSELICWQIARDLRREVFSLTSKAAFNQNFKLRGQLQDASSSACANISEGFGRLTHREFHRFLEVSRSSVNEVEDRLNESVEKRYLSEEEIRTALSFCKRTRVATSRLMASLKERPDPEWNRWPSPRSRT